MNLAWKVSGYSTFASICTIALEAGLARRFTVSEKLEGEDFVLRLLPSPIDQYPLGEGKKELTGAVFVFVHGTNPEALLTIEPTGDGAYQPVEEWEGETPAEPHTLENAARQEPRPPREWIFNRRLQLNLHIPLQNRTVLHDTDVRRNRSADVVVLDQVVAALAEDADRFAHAVLFAAVEDAVA